MITVKLPRADWDVIELLLEDYAEKGHFVQALLKDIQQQTWAQEA